LFSSSATVCFKNGGGFHNHECCFIAALAIVKHHASSITMREVCKSKLKSYTISSVSIIFVPNLKRVNKTESKRLNNAIVGVS